MLDNQQCFKDKTNPPGLCKWVINMEVDSLITLEEAILLSSYINNNPPFIYKMYRFFNNLYRGFTHEPYYWKPGNIKPRIAWIKKHIKKNK